MVAFLTTITLMLGNLLISQQGWVSLQGPEGGAMPYILCLPSDYLNLIGSCAVSEEVNYISGSGIYFSQNFGARWYLREKGINWSKGGIHQMDFDVNNPSVIYIAQGGGSTGYKGGVYKTTDAGLTWFDISPIDTCFHAIYCSRNNPNIILAGALYGGIYRSTNGGVNWIKINDVRCNEFAYDPRYPDTVYVAGAVSDYIYRSTDCGLTWSQIGTSLPYANIISIAVDSESSNIIYAISDQGQSQTVDWGVYRSSNFGNTWTPVLIAPNGYSHFYKIRVSPLDPQIVWVVGFVLNGKGVYLSTNRGLSFQEVTSFWGRSGYGVCPLPNNRYGAIVSGYGGVSITTDLGTTWRRKNFRLHANAVYSLAVVNQNLIYAGCYGARHWGGIHKTTDGGKSWINILEGNGVYHVAVDPSNSNILIAHNGGSLKSTDGGINWYGYSPSFYRVSFSRANPNYVWGANSEGQTGYPPGIYKSVNKGDVYTLTTNPADTGWSAVAPHPVDTNIVLAIRNWKGASQIWRTTNCGQTWAVVYTVPYLWRLLDDIGFSNSSPNIAYACGYRTFVKSTDGGLTWDSLPSPNFYNSHRLSIHPTNPNEVLIANYRGIFYTSDGGNTWLDISYSQQEAYDVAWLQEGNNYSRYIGNSRGVHIWGIMDTLRPSVSVIQPNGGEILGVGQSYNIIWQASDNQEVEGIDIFYSIDGGNNYRVISCNEVNDGIYPWTVPDTPSDSCYVRVDAYDFAGNLMSDRSNNYFTISQVGIAELKNNNAWLSLKGTINPVLRLQVKTSSSIDFTLYDCTGSVVYRFGESNFQGERKIEFNNLSSGVYFYTLTEGGTTTKGKFVVIK